MSKNATDPESLSNKYPQIWDIIESERIAMYTGLLNLTEKEATDYEVKTNNSTALLGNCHMSSSELAKRLYDEGYDPILVLGLLLFSGEPTGSNDPAESVYLTNFHAWVEIPWKSSPTGYLVLEVCTEKPDVAGMPYISPHRPDVYNANNSRFEWEPWMDHRIVGVESRVSEFLHKSTHISKD